MYKIVSIVLEHSHLKSLYWLHLRKCKNETVSTGILIIGLCFGWVENIEVPLLLGLSDYIENWVTKIKLGGFLALSLHGDIFPGYIGLLSPVLNC